MKLRTFFVTLVFLVAAATSGLADSQKITAKEAGAYVGQNMTVCGHVTSASYGSHLKGQPTFLNLDAPYPQHIFTVIIFGNSRAAFGEPEKIYADKNICVTGRIKSHKGKPEIIARHPSQITLAQ
jgi:DNA/RNA endonuclease YhcR with UshA esterase domain